MSDYTSPILSFPIIRKLFSFVRLGEEIDVDLFADSCVVQCKGMVSARPGNFQLDFELRNEEFVATESSGDLAVPWIIVASVLFISGSVLVAMDWAQGRAIFSPPPWGPVTAGIGLAPALIAALAIGYKRQIVVNPRLGRVDVVTSSCGILLASRSAALANVTAAIVGLNVVEPRVSMFRTYAVILCVRRCFVVMAINSKQEEIAEYCGRLARHIGVAAESSDVQLSAPEAYSPLHDGI